MQNNKLKILMGLGILAFLSLVYGILTPSQRQQQSLQDKSTSILEEDEKMIPIPRVAKKTSFVTWGRNPFLLSAKSSAGPILNGIIWDDKKPMAIINDNVVGVGDHVGSNQVADIQQDRVILSDGVNTVELRMKAAP